MKYSWNKLTADSTTGFVGLAQTKEMKRNRAGKWESRKVWKCYICEKVEETDRHGLPADWAEKWITPQHPMIVCGGCRHKNGMS